MTTATIVFDLDGTLVDSAPDMAFAVNVVLGRRGLGPLPLEGVVRTIGDGVRMTVARSFAAVGAPLDAGALGEAEAELLAVYLDPARGPLSRLYPGVATTLALLADRGIALGVCTNKAQAAADRTLADLGIAARFGVVLGGDATDHRKPDPRHLAACLKALGRDARGAAMIGDSTTDEEAARGAGVLFLGVRYGYGAFGASAAAVDRFAEIPTALGL